ncbi:hypothetical protein HED60_24400 [Planctomycetales bacterium ZRK34]|nr:hypothetical protein HED60_24400 [Planctomycetales bacterium ZRK34]
MSQMNTGGKPISRKPSNNVYSILVFIAFVALAIAVGVTWWKNVELTGPEQPNAGFKSPFYVTEEAKT